MDCEKASTSVILSPASENRLPASEQRHSLEIENASRNPAASYLIRFKRKLLEILQGHSKLYWFLLTLSFVALFAGIIPGTLLLRFYFAEGGSRKWLSTWIQTAGFPLLMAATAIYYWMQGLRMTRLTPQLLGAYTVLGILGAIDNFLFTCGVAYLPASTVSLLMSSQLAFNAVFGLLIVHQRISVFGWNAIFLVTSSAIILAFDSDNTKLEGVSKSKSILGYIMVLAAAALFGLIYPLYELVLRKFFSEKGSSKSVLELQVGITMISTVVATIGMIINHDFAAISKEAKSFKSGQTAYYMTLIWTAISWQAAFVGSTGIIFLSSSLLAGVSLALGIPLGSVFAVAFFHDSFGGLKVMSMLLSLWGFASYIYGAYLDQKAESSKKAADDAQSV